MERPRTVELSEINDTHKRMIELYRSCEFSQAEVIARRLIASGRSSHLQTAQAHAILSHGSENYVYVGPLTSTCTLNKPHSHHAEQARPLFETPRTFRPAGYSENVTSDIRSGIKRAEADLHTEAKRMGHLAIEDRTTIREAYYHRHDLFKQTHGRDPSSEEVAPGQREPLYGQQYGRERDYMIILHDAYENALTACMTGIAPETDLDDIAASGLYEFGFGWIDESTPAGDWYDPAPDEFGYGFGFGPRQTARRSYGLHSPPRSPP
ncbi:Hypothetical protein D9617_22g067100 [Elsinoe fawcettii]|nr:Hypothetical protein D9617_22g067100 [Elsinoe fawcettii]